LQPPFFCKYSDKPALFIANHLHYLIPVRKDRFWFLFTQICK
jgi:hypothetical protein